MDKKRKILRSILSVFIVLSFFVCLPRKTYASNEKLSETVPEVNEGQKEEEIRILLTGDVMCLGGQQETSGGDYKPAFRQVKRIFNGADLTIGNLETLISKSIPITSKKKYEDNMPVCNAPKEFLEAVRYAGYDAVVTANNHTCDNGIQGIIETLDELEKYRIKHTGTTYSSETSNFILLTAKDITVGLMSYSELINRRYLLTDEDYREYASLYSKEAVERDVALAREAGADIVIVYDHWGMENTTELTQEQTSHARAIAEAGADIVIGSHSHCLQPCEYIETSDGRRVLCMYSMGNFVSSMARDINRDTIILEAKVGKRNGKAVITDIGYYPCCVRNSKGYEYSVVPIELNGDGSAKKSEHASSLARIKDVINGVIPALDPSGAPGFVPAKLEKSDKKNAVHGMMP